MKRLVELRIVCEVEDLDSKSRYVRVTLPKCRQYHAGDWQVRWEKNDPRFDGEIIGWGNGDECWEK